MKVSNRKGIANQTGPESCLAHREVRDEALTGERFVLEGTRKWNVRDSDGTVVFSLGPKLTGGSLKTEFF